MKTFPILPMKLTTKRQYTELEVDSFEWSQHGGQLIKPRDMATSHLYNTVMMLWNNTAPEEFKRRPFKEWTLPRHPNYYRLAVSAMLKVLTERSDLTAEQMEGLVHISNCIVFKPELIQKEI